MRFSGWPVFAADEIEAVQGVLASGKVNYWTGPHGKAFEQEFAAYHGGGHAVALANGTLALEIALRALGIGAGDEVVVPCRTFIATASSVAAVGARPVVADVEPASGNVTAAGIEAALTPTTRAVIVVHLGGLPCEMDAIAALCKARGLKLIEDCAQAIGAEYRGRKVGTLGDAAAFSFCQDKIVSTGGEGGMLLLPDEASWRRAWSYKDHGKNPDKALKGSGGGGTFVWLHDEFGSNARMTEMQAAIGRLQLGKLDDWTARRRANAAVLAGALGDTPGLLADAIPAYMEHAAYRFYLRVDEAALNEGWDRDRIVRDVAAGGVPCFQGSCSEIYREAAFEKHGFAPAKRLPGAMQLDRTSLCLLCHPTLDSEHMQQMADVLNAVMQKATG